MTFKSVMEIPCVLCSANFLVVQEKQMQVREDCAVKEVKEGRVETLTGDDVEFDECLWCTQAGAPDWLKSTGLPLGDVDQPQLVNHWLV